ncbi:MAG TPA: glycosyltransferase family 4 protein [Thermodesulfobacteriota bacterium]|nr:glycosyltransferase family 4 protein [Thermodesulfobacteriota bacterium]
MYIRIIRTHYPHWSKHSGINQLIKYIDQGKYNLDVQIVSDNDGDFPIQNRIVRNGLRRIVQKQGMQWYKLSDLWAEIKTFGKCLRRKVDVIHYLDGEHSAQYLPWLKKWGKLRTKIVATFHQPPDLLDSLVIRNAIRELDYVTVISPEQVSYFREFVASDKIQLILHGIDIGYFRPGTEPKEENKFKCITVGHWLRDFKAVREVAMALSSYRNIEFHIVSSQATGVEDLANVTVYRGIDDVSLLKLYQRSDILFLPLLQSTANNSLLEGVACGLPVVSTPLPSVKTYLSGKEAVLIRDNDPKQFVDAILNLAHNPEYRRDMAQSARRRAEELDWRNIAPQYEAMYSKLINYR